MKNYVILKFRCNCLQAQICECSPSFPIGLCIVKVSIRATFFICIIKPFFMGITFKCGDKSVKVGSNFVYFPHPTSATGLTETVDGRSV